MTGIERIGNILKRKPVDRIGLYEHFWGDTHKDWISAGFIGEGVSMADHFNFDIEEFWAFNLVINTEFVPEVLEETNDTIVTRDGNGAVLRRHKKHDSTPEHIDFSI